MSRQDFGRIRELGSIDPYRRQVDDYPEEVLQRLLPLQEEDEALRDTDIRHILSTCLHNQTEDLGALAVGNDCVVGVDRGSVDNFPALTRRALANELNGGRWVSLYTGPTRTDRRHVIDR